MDHVLSFVKGMVEQLEYEQGQEREKLEKTLDVGEDLE